MKTIIKKIAKTFWQMTCDYVIPCVVFSFFVGMALYTYKENVFGNEIISKGYCICMLSITAYIMYFFLEDVLNKIRFYIKKKGGVR